MALRETFAVLRQKDIPASEWKVQGPGGKSYKVIEHRREHIPESINCGKVTFVVQTDADSGSQETLVGFVGDVTTDEQGSETMTPSAAEAITRNGAPLPEANIDGGLAGSPVLRGFRLKFRGNVILKFQYADDNEEDGIGEYRFEAKFGEIGL